MKKNILLLLLINVCCYNVSIAQGFKDLKTKSGKNLFSEGRLMLLTRYSSITPQSDKYKDVMENETIFPTINMALSIDNTDKWGLKWSWENPMIGDGLAYLVRGFGALKKEGANVGEVAGKYTQTFSALIIGWHHINMNVFTTDRLLIAPGISTGDMQLVTTIPSQRFSHNEEKKDPAGYFLYAGPSLKISYVINKKLWIDAFANYDFMLTKGFKPSQNYGKDDYPNYPLPTTMFFGANLYSTSRLFGGFRVGKMTDKGIHGNHAQRVDVSLGVRLARK